MGKTLLSRNSLAERWDFESTNVIAKYEREGIITRVDGVPAPRYSIDEIEKLESVSNKNPLSPIERRRMEKKIDELENELEIYKNLFGEIKSKLLMI